MHFCEKLYIQFLEKIDGKCCLWRKFGRKFCLWRKIGKQNCLWRKGNKYEVCYPLTVEKHLVENVVSREKRALWRKIR